MPPDPSVANTSNPQDITLRREVLMATVNTLLYVRARIVYYYGAGFAERVTTV
jgi:hypothetical protein